MGVRLGQDTPPGSQRENLGIRGLHTGEKGTVNAKPIVCGLSDPKNNSVSDRKNDHFATF